MIGKLAVIAMATLSVASPAVAQEFPSRPVTIVVPLAAGTGMDTLARSYADKLTQRLGKPVLVDNRPGAGTMLGTAAVAKASPDGQTLLVATNAAMAISPVVQKSLAYDPERDFVPLAWYVKSPFILIVSPNLPVRSVRELVAYAKARATPLSYTSPGPGSAQHLSMVFMNQKFGLEMTHVPHRNTGQAISDLVAGHIDLGFLEAGASIPLIKEGKLRALAVSASSRLPLLSDVPPLAEATDAPDFEAVGWHVLFAPAMTPRPIVDRLHDEMKQIMAAPEMMEKASQTGLIPIDTPSVEKIRSFIRSEQQKWGNLVRSLGLEHSN